MVDEQVGLLGRNPIKPEGERFAIRWLHEYDTSLAPAEGVVDVSQDITDWLMLGNGPDPTLTITTVNGPGAPVGDCYFAGEAHDTMLAGAEPTANGVVGEYDTYSDQFSGGQDNGVVVADALLWQHQRGEIGLFAPVHPTTIPAVMAKYRRGILTGVNLTGCDQSNFPVPGWDVGSNCQPDPTLGHVVYQVKSYPDGSAALVSWGQVVMATARWMQACPEEWWILLTPADRAAMGEAAYDALAADLAAIPGSTGTPPPGPTPQPIPEPPGPPPAPPAPPGALEWLRELLAWVEAHL